MRLCWFLHLHMQTINIGHENKKDLDLIKLSDFVVRYFICWSEVNSPLGDRILSLCYRTPCDNIWAELANSRSSPILAPCLRSPLTWALWPRDCQKFILYLWFFYRIYMLFYHCFIQGNLLASEIGLIFDLMGILIGKNVSNWHNQVHICPREHTSKPLTHPATFHCIVLLQKCNIYYFYFVAVCHKQQKYIFATVQLQATNQRWAIR